MHDGAQETARDIFVGMAGLSITCPQQLTDIETMTGKVERFEQIANSFN